jgi:hypothetical protein
MSFEINGDEFLQHLAVIEMRTVKAAQRATHDAVDDLARISQNIAPIDKGTLRRSVDKDVRIDGTKVIGEVSFSATEESSGYGRFNYALWTHEMDYELGDQSKAAPGTDGYEVGNKYLERPLKGEAEKYIKWWIDAIGKEMD